jgi:glycolate oxidase iron-sulfur subunit
MADQAGYDNRMSRPKPNPEAVSLPQRSETASGRSGFPLADADLCVKCGLCLPHCPTYRLFQDESESPRGRISLMQGLATGQLEASSRLEKHLNQCLGCRNCEPVCPANVPYGRLIDHGRNLLAQRRTRPRSERLAAWAFGRPRVLTGLARALRLVERLGLRRLARLSLLKLSSRLRRLDALLPESRPIRRRPEKSGDGEPVQLFLGCIAEAVDSPVTDAALRLLTATGYEVHIPTQQGCCGAVSQHGGDLAQANQHAKQNVGAFSGDTPILASASGCTATLMEYPELQDDTAHRQFSRRVHDLCAFLAEEESLRNIEWRTLNARILLHTPCSQRNVVGAGPHALELIKRLPGAHVEALEGQGQCCGAAGAYLLSQPDIADRLGKQLADKALLHRPDFVLTTNIGCKLQLRAQLASRLPDCEVLHPVELLARQLPPDP